MQFVCSVHFCKYTYAYRQLLVIERTSGLIFVETASCAPAAGPVGGGAVVAAQGRLGAHGQDRQAAADGRGARHIWLLV